MDSTSLDPNFFLNLDQGSSNSLFDQASYNPLDFSTFLGIDSTPTDLMNTSNVTTNTPIQPPSVGTGLQITKDEQAHVSQKSAPVTRRFLPPKRPRKQHRSGFRQLPGANGVVKKGRPSKKEYQMAGVEIDMYTYKGITLHGPVKSVEDVDVKLASKRSKALLGKKPPTRSIGVQTDPPSAYPTFTSQTPPLVAVSSSNASSSSSQTGSIFQQGMEVRDPFYYSGILDTPQNSSAIQFDAYPSTFGVDQTQLYQTHGSKPAGEFVSNGDQTFPNFHSQPMSQVDELQPNLFSELLAYPAMNPVLNEQITYPRVDGQSATNYLGYPPLENGGISTNPGDPYFFHNPYLPLF
ncbi:hypothetical protein O181_008880 [Austropuccinia psidii MF-1]|uniref:Uncharacterized protein n=1 Tax=Austropuccinia psidii MF-1 TaxID=1389203 RepID=A0A9Q3GJB7_9BASI|nr:hypothetical protein [Austropuccinia psidii MF-1]